VIFDDGDRMTVTDCRAVEIDGVLYPTMAYPRAHGWDHPRMNFVAWFALSSVFLLLTAVSLIHIVTHPIAHMPRWAWALLVIFTFPVGSILYFVVSTPRSLRR